MTDRLLGPFAREFASEFAAVLARHPVEEGVELLGQLADPDVLAVLAVLARTHLGPVLEHLGDDRVAALVDRAPFELAAGLLLRLSPVRRGLMLERISDPRRRRELERRLVWADGTLGAIAVRDVASMPVDATVGDLVATLRARDVAGGAPVDVWVLGAGGKLRGRVDLVRALEATDADTPLARCMLPAAELPADMPARAAGDLPVWGSERVVAVVDARRRLVGTITLGALREATRVRTVGDDALAIAAEVGDGFLDTLASLAAILFSAPAADARREGPQR